MPPVGSSRRPVDITMKYLGPDSNIAVLAFHEAKSLAARPSDTEDVEYQPWKHSMPV